MATSEQSFADRLARGRTMQAAVAGFTPAFNPADANIAPSAFSSYLNGVEAANDEVSTAEATLAPLIDERIAAAAALKDKALRVKDFVSSNAAWKKYIKPITTAANAVRGYRVPKKTTPAAPAEGGETPKKTRQGVRSQQGFGDLKKLFSKLIEQVKKITGYTTPASSGLSVAELETQDSAFLDLNASIDSADATLSEAQRMRREYYNGENGLKEKMKAIKKAVRAQYGSGSPEDTAVKSIAL